MKLKKGDKVVVITGKDKGRQGEITKVYPKDNKVIVSGINQFKRHLKRQNEQNPGGIIEVERPINASKIMLLDPTTNEPTRVGYEIKNGQKIRISKKSKSPIDKK
jgi:large subunit ribosomal protein L24